MAFLIASGDRVNGSCTRWQVASMHLPQNSRWQHMSFGTPVALMRVMMFCPPARSTWESGVLGTLWRRFCWSLYSRLGRQLSLGFVCATFWHLYGLLMSWSGWRLPNCCGCGCAGASCAHTWTSPSWAFNVAGCPVGGFSADGVWPLSILLKVMMETKR